MQLPQYTHTRTDTPYVAQPLRHILAVLLHRTAGVHWPKWLARHVWCMQLVIEATVPHTVDATVRGTVDATHA